VTLSIPVRFLLALSLVATGIGLALPAQREARGRAGEVTEISVPGRSARALLWSEADENGRLVPYYRLSLDGIGFGAARQAHDELALRLRQFDPLLEEPRLPAGLEASAESRLFVVQYHTQGIEDYRAALRALGGVIHRFLPYQANLVELDREALPAVRALPFVRSVTPFHPAYKLHENLLAAIARGDSEPLRVNLLTLRRHGQAPVVDWIQARGGVIDELSEPTYLMSATLPATLLVELAGLDDVQWIERWYGPENDMDIAREMHGSNYVETLYGMTGQGVRVEVMDGGFDMTHPDMQNFLVHNGNTTASHGTCTSGIVVGTGLGNPAARGCVPDAFLVVADYDQPYGGGNRYAHTGQLVDPLGPYQCVVQSNSWGGGLTSSYDATSQDMDLILFDHSRISICQSQSNTGSTLSRPQAWAKNIVSVGGIVHHNTLSKNDDNWSGASIGPAQDGRIKPDIASYYDAILCTDRIGSLGYSSGDYFTSFGGTSGATPIVAGHLALIYQMWDQGLFGNPTPGATVFENAPQNTTAKALMINGASQWSFSGTTHNRTRTHQGWGHPDLKRLSDSTARMLVVDETDVLTELQSKDYFIEVAAGEPLLRVTMVYRDPPGTTSSSIHRINDLDLTVVSPGGDVYHGNFGLDAGTTSTAGGSANTKDTVENVYVASPQVGVWIVTVTASEVNEDSHVETGVDDVDYALVVSGAVEVPPTPPVAPGGLAARGSAHSVDLRFNDLSNNEAGFEAEFSLDGTNFSLLAVLLPNSTQALHKSLTPDTTYYYRLRSFNSAGTSAYTPVVSARTNKAIRAP